MIVRDAYTWSTEKTDLKDFLGVSGDSEDTRLEAWFDAALVAADKYMDRDFVPQRYRWTLSGTPVVGDTVTVSVWSPHYEDQVEYTHVVSTGETLTQICRDIQDELEDDLLKYEHVCSYGGPALIVKTSDWSETIEASCVVTQEDGSTLAVSERVEWDSVPELVKAGVYAYVKAARNLRIRGHGVASVRTGALQENYRTGEPETPLFAALHYWKPYKSKPHLAGGL